VINLPPDGSDNLINVIRISEDQEVLLITKKGKAIRFSSKEVRSMGRASYGVKGINLSKNDEIVSIEGVQLDKKISILTVTAKGYGKRSSLNDYRKTSRGGKGVINLKISDKTGEVVKSMSVINSDSIILTTTKGMILRTSMKDLRIMGRATQGVKIVRLKEGDKVADSLRVPREEEIKEKSE
jgi:DNA gyrase subunit A